MEENLANDRRKGGGDHRRPAWCGTGHRRLREAGFEELLGLAVMPADLAEEAELGEAVSAKILAAAKK